MKIQLEPAKPGDGSLIYESWGKNRENFKYLSVFPQQNPEDAATYLKMALKDENRAFHIVEMQSSKIAGLIKAKIEGHRALVGYVIDKKYWGKGYATEAVSFILEELNKSKSVKRIWATCALNNPGSSRVLEKNGFIREGILRNWIVYPSQGNAPHDNYAYSWPKKI